MSTVHGLIRPYSFWLIQIHRLTDALWIPALLYATLALAGAWSFAHLPLVVLALACFALCAEHNHLYRSWRVAALDEELSVLWRSWLATALVVVFAAFVFDDLPRPERRLLLAWLSVTPLLLSATRVAARLAIRAGRLAGRNFRTAAIVGANETGRRVAERLLHNRWMGIRLLGYFEDRVVAAGRELVEGPVPVIGDVQELVARAHGGGIDIVYVALPMRAEQRVRKLVETLADTTASVYYVADFMVFDLLHAQWETLGGVPILRLVDSPFTGYNGFAKRVLDIALSLSLLLLCALPMALIALAVKLSSPGPILFRQKRHGLDGGEFTIWKFRTMAPGGEGEPDGRQTTRQDPRTTRLGRLLRRSSLDELPQLVNVLQGQMSLVGPRPHPTGLNDQHRALINRFFLRHKVRPGMTGWAQVNGCRGETETSEKMKRRLEYDLEYINNWSFWLDLRILVLTALRAWRDENAY
jgi:putative colanic acid biosysnthesis UDP-glucose lipid carrier transferase